jgi:glycosyltransferase involved in cell wall biosynthesis
MVQTMTVIRVGFVLEQVGWLGGVNYFRNLFLALQSLPDAKIKPVVFTGMRSDVSAFEGLVTIIRSPVFDRFTFPWLIRKILVEMLRHRDYQLYWLMRSQRIDLLSHSDRFWNNCSIPSLEWIPDFQHLHLPEFFSREELLQRNIEFMRMIRESDAMLLSSQDALDDLNRFCPDNSTPTHILRFVSCIQPNLVELSNRADLVARYNLDRPWFYIPNQFWAHKNHVVVIEALHYLKNKGINPLVIATGRTNDHRNTDYFPSLINRVKMYNLYDNFRILGVVPYADVIGLMRYSLAIINPSLFEGWSTSVEESKAMGKALILSDIAVHREQNPTRGNYFDANDPIALANNMMATMQQHNEDEDSLWQEKAKTEQKINMETFAKQYEKIVLQVVGRKNK